MTYYDDHDYDEDRCPICKEVYEVDVDPFTWGPGRYKSYCACTAKLEKEEAEGARGHRRDLTYQTPTLGDLLEQRMKENQ